jgi:16S rRNA (cytidine1402-2'-O)-methyltransferase
MLERPLPAGLYLVSTPIGHLGDVTLRGLAVLANAAKVYCEDTRHTLRLLARYGISRQLSSYHDHNAERVRPGLLAEIAIGTSVALVSDAGTPLISDPGYKLVLEALDQGLAVQSVPGPSALLAGLVGSGLPTDCFTFGGFLPPKAGARRARIAELSRAPGTLILFEAANRLSGSLSDLGGVLGPDRPAAIARELTKLHEETIRGTLGELSSYLEQGSLRGEIVLLVATGEPATRDVTDERITEALSGEATGSLKQRARAVADRLGIGRTRVYELALKLTNDKRN